MQHSVPGPRDPQKTKDEPVDSDSQQIVNTGEQQQVVNQQALEPDTAGKEKGFQEGTHNDSLTEAEPADSDGQPTFPEEEGNLG